MIGRSVLVLTVAGLLVAGSVSGRGAEPVDAATVCGTCHGRSGVPVSKEIPVIWGQQEGYIYVQLRDFKSGARANEIMSAIVATLSRDDMLALASYFAAKSWPNLGQASASEALAKQAETASNAVGCPACHSDRFQGNGTTPRVAGQNEAYIARTLNDFRTGARANNPGMSNLVRAMTEPDVVAMEKYLAGL